MTERAGWKTWLVRVGAGLGVVLLLAIFWLATLSGVLSQALAFFLFVSALIALVRLVLDVVRRRVSFRAYRQPRVHVRALVAVVLRLAAWLTFAWAFHVAVVPVVLSERDAMELTLAFWTVLVVLVAYSLVPRQKPSLAIDALLVALLVWVVLELGRGHADPPRAELVEIESPLVQPMYIFHGGSGSLFNHHKAVKHQAWALDVVTLAPNGLVYEGDPAKLTSYACFGVALRAPVSGRVAHVRSDRPDMAIGDTDSEVLVGNSVTIEMDGGKYVLLAHLQAGSITVREGDRVSAGQEVARCGNSGNTSMPHLHLQVQNRPQFSPTDRELRTFPIAFTGARRLRHGEPTDSPFSVRRNDIVEAVGVAHAAAAD